MAWTAEQYGKRFFEEICSRDLEGIEGWVGQEPMFVWRLGQCTLPKGQLCSEEC